MGYSLYARINTNSAYNVFHIRMHRHNRLKYRTIWYKQYTEHKSLVIRNRMNEYMCVWAVLYSGVKMWESLAFAKYKT